MKRLYARFVLWLIRPALDRSAEIEAAHVRARVDESLSRSVSDFVNRSLRKN